MHKNLKAYGAGVAIVGSTAVLVGLARGDLSVVKAGVALLEGGEVPVLAEACFESSNRIKAALRRAVIYTVDILEGRKDPYQQA